MIEVDEQEQQLKLAIIREKCESSHLFFTRYFFKVRNGFKFKVNWHHHVLADIVDQIIQGKLKNVLINIGPGSSKTETIVVNFIARGIALNPYARFLHLTYSDTLASLNSQTARDVVNTDEFQMLWPTKLSTDDSAKSRWNVEVDEQKAGGCYAVSTGGQVTGFRAGRMVEGFQGAIIIDDPLKPEDAFSKPKTTEANRKLISTIKSRKANPETPIVVIMQRLSENDPSAFIKSGNLDDQGKWEFVNIPALIDEKWIQENRKWISDELLQTIDGTDQDDDGRFSYWPYKEPLATLVQMEKGTHTDQEGAKMSRIVFAGQYMQNPVAIGGNILRGEWFVKYKVLPKLRSRYIFGDTAQKTGQRNDYSVFECWGEGLDGKIYLIDLIRGKWEAHELKKRAIAFWMKHSAQNNEQMGQLRKFYVEDKSSGTGLIQDMKYEARIPVEGIERNTDKLTRVLDVQPHVEAQNVCVPEEAPFTHDFIVECEGFTADDTHAHDDQIDPMVDAITKLLSNKNKLKQWEKQV